MAEIKIVKYDDYPADIPESKWVVFRVLENGLHGDVDAFVPLAEQAGLTNEEIVALAYSKVEEQVNKVKADLASKNPIVGMTFTPATQG